MGFILISFQLIYSDDDDADESDVSLGWEDIEVITCNLF